jgi:hypothetical protein
MDEHVVAVPIERLLASRNWLGQQLIAYGCEVRFTPGVEVLLARHEDEVRAVDDAFAHGVEPAPFEELLAQSRFRRSLRWFQERDLAHLLALGHGANFSVPGAGKTTTALALYEALRVREQVSRLLVISPLSAFDAWITEAAECLDPPADVRILGERGSASAEVLLVNYQRLSGVRYDRIADWVQDRPCQLILDEAHRMKRGRRGEWGAACLDLAQLAVRRDILTGTPAPQSPADFIALLEFLWPNQSQRILPAGARGSNPSDDDMDAVSRRLRPLFVRTKKDELGLREPDLRVEETTMKPAQQEIYDAIRSRMGRAIRGGGRDHAALARMGAVTMYLLQAASNPGLLARALGEAEPSSMEWPSAEIPLSSDVADLIRRYGAYEMPAKFEKVSSLAVQNAGKPEPQKTLVWSNFVGNLEELRVVLAPLEPAVIHGGIGSSATTRVGRTREEELRRFRHDDSCMVLLANPAAMAEGVSLHHSCHDAIYVDRTFNAGQYLQSLDRIHRLGLAEEVETTMTFLSSVGTIDETVDGRLRVKAQRLAQMLQDDDLVTMALPDDESYGEYIDLEDLDALFGHLGNDDEAGG